METKSQFRRLIGLFIGIFLLITFPSIFGVYNILIYSIGVIILIFLMLIRVIKDKYFEERFFKRWHNSRGKGFWINSICEGFRLLVLVPVVTCLSQFLVNGLTPLQMVSILPNHLLLILIFISFFGGMAVWFENEKRYERMLHNKQFNIQ